MTRLRVTGSDITPEMMAPFVGKLRWEDLQPGDEQESWTVLRWAIACDETFRRAALALMTPAPDVMAVYLGSVDKCGHRFIKYRDPAGCGFSPRRVVGLCLCACPL